MKNYSEYEMAGETTADKEMIDKALNNGHELQVDIFNRVLDEEGNWNKYNRTFNQYLCCECSMGSRWSAKQIDLVTIKRGKGDNDIKIKLNVICSTESDRLKIMASFANELKKYGHCMLNTDAACDAIKLSFSRILQAEIEAGRARVVK